MLKMPQVNLIRDLASSGYSVTDICKETGHDHKTVEKYLKMDDFSQGPPTTAQKMTLMDPYKDVILEWWKEDKQHWKKQRHTAKRIYDRLVAEFGFTGSYDTVQKYVHKLRGEMNESGGSLELIWAPGYAQVDFGEADFYEENECRRRKYLVVSFPFSNDGFVQVFGGETAECVAQGLQDIFNYIGGVPPMLVFDNATGVGRRVCDKVTETELFSRFRAHYNFQIRFCNPMSGNEKGNVENKVGTIRRNIFVPVPHYHDMIEYNKTVLDEHLKKASELHFKKKVLIAELFEKDKASFLPLPAKPFNVCRYDTYKCDGYGKICMEGKHFYSTKPENHNRNVLVGIRAHYIEILNQDGTLLVRHRREYGSERTDTTDYSTMLRELSHKAGAWMNSGVRQDVSDVLREYMDSLEKTELKNCLRILSDINDEYGYRAALDALELAIKNGNVNRNDMKVLAERITGYGIDTPPSPGPSLWNYDEAFINNRKNAVTGAAV